MTHRPSSHRLVVSLMLGVAACSSDQGTGLAPCTASRGTAVTLAVGKYTSIDPTTDGGCVVIAANASTIDTAEYLLAPQSAAGTFGDSFPFSLRGAAAGAAAAVTTLRVAAPAPPSTAERFDALLRRMARARSYPAPPLTPPAGAAPRASVAAGPPVVGTVRSFKVCAVLDCSQFQQVTGVVKTVGAHIAIYVDTMAPPGGLDSADLDTLKQLFDTRLFPLDTATFGAVSDIDNNGVVIVLMTNVVNALVTASQCMSAGYVTGFFFAGDLDPRFSTAYNHGEVFYSLVADPLGTLSCPHQASQVKSVLPGTFVHELQHMISFDQHVLVLGASAEEGWLDEGLSKYAEELAGRSFLPGDTTSFQNYVHADLTDAYQYLEAPASAPLLIEYDDGTIPEIGASWLFVRYLMDQGPTALPRMLDQSSLTGSANVAAQMGTPFPTLVARWALANWVSDLPGFTASPELTYTSWRFRSTYASLNAKDPSHFPMAFPLVPSSSDGPSVNVSGELHSGSTFYYRALQAPAAPAFTLSFSVNGGGLPGFLGAHLATFVAARLTIIRIR